MLQKLVFVLFLFGSCSLTAQNISVADSLEITKKIDDWNTAWKIKDATLASKWYTPEADFTNAFGFSMIGKENIKEYLTEVFGFAFVMAGESKQTSLKLKKVAKNVILAITTIERVGQQTAKKESLGTRQTTHHRLFSKTDEWYITAHLISDARATEKAKH